LDHILLLVFITLEEEFIQEKKRYLVENSDKEIECITQEFVLIAEDLWNKFSKLVNITQRSKVW